MICPKELLAKIGLTFAPCPCMDWSINFKSLAETDFWLSIVREAVGTALFITVSISLGGRDNALSWGFSYAMVKMFMNANMNALCQWYGFLTKKNNLGEFLFPLFAQMIGGLAAFHLAVNQGTTIGFGVDYDFHGNRETRSVDAENEEIVGAVEVEVQTENANEVSTGFFSQTAELQAVIFFVFISIMATKPNMPDSIWSALKIAAAFFVGGSKTFLFPGNAFSHGTSDVINGFSTVAMQIFAVFVAWVIMTWFWPINFGKYGEEEKETFVEKVEDALSEAGSAVEEIVEKIADKVEDIVDEIKD